MTVHSRPVSGPHFPNIAHCSLQIMIVKAKRSPDICAVKALLLVTDEDEVSSEVVYKRLPLWKDF